MSGRRSILFLVIFLTFCIIIFSSGCREYIPFIAEEREETDTSPPSPEEELPKGEEEEVDEEEAFPEDMLPLTIYLLDGKGKYLIPVTIPVPWTESVGQTSVEKLIEGPTPSQEMRFGFTSPIPPTAEVRGLNIRDGLARIDLSAEFLEYDPGKERDVLDSIIFTMLQFPTVNEVEIMVDGEMLEEFPGGSPGGITYTAQRGLNLEVEEDIDYDESQQAVLYFCTTLGENYIFYVPVTRVVDGGLNNIEVAIRELLEGPVPDTGLFSDIPPETEVLGMSLEDGELEVNLSGEIMEYKGGRSGEENIKNQLVLTMTELDEVEKVQFLIEGERTIFPEGTSLQEPFVRPDVINRLPAD